MGSKNKSVKQLIEEAVGKTPKGTPSWSHSSMVSPQFKSSKSVKSLVKDLSGNSKASKVSTEKYDKQVQKIKHLKDSLNELQASYSNLNDLFNNTVDASDSTITSLLQDLRYTIDRLDRADFELKYDAGSGSLFIDGEDSVSVSTPEVLSMLSALVSLFPNKSISLEIDGDSDYTDQAAIDKLTELNGSPAEPLPAIQPTHTSPEGDIDTVLGGVGDSKIKDNVVVLEPANRFTCTYKDDAYSVWDKQLGTLVKVVGTPKEADALLEGLITGVTTSSSTATDPDGSEPGEDFDVDLEEEPTEDVMEDSRRVMDSLSSSVSPTWETCSEFDASRLTSLGFKGKAIDKYLNKVLVGLQPPFFSRLPAFSFFLDKSGDKVSFSLDSEKAQDFLKSNEEFLKKYCESVLSVGGLSLEDSFLTAYADKLRSLLHS